MTDPVFVRWNDAENRFVQTTANDPRRMIVKADVEPSFFSWFFATAAGAVVGAIVVDALVKK